MHFVYEKSFALRNNTSVCGGCPEEGEKELQLVEIEEVKVTPVTVRPHP